MSGFSINTVTVSGNLTRDPEVKSLDSGMSVCNLGIAYNERFKNKRTDEWEDRAHYFNVTVWGGVGEWVGRNLSKGTPVVVSGRLTFRQWEKDGEKRSAVDITADSIVSMRDSGGGGNSNSNGSERSDIPVDTGDFTPASTASAAPKPDDDIPFTHDGFPEYEERRVHVSRW